jgi:trehalose-phosphatase
VLIDSNMKPALPLSPDVALRVSASPLAILLDIDGTLAPIAPRPQQALVPPETCAAVEALMRLPGVHVAIVTGRSVADARRLVGIPGLAVIGNHGFEVLGEDGDPISVPAAHSYLGAIRDAATSLDGLARRVEGTVLEDKKWTLSLHYRLAERPAIPMVVDFINQLAAEHGLVVTRGKEVLELRPPLEVNKGTAAVLWTRDVGTPASGSVLYIGDDRTDEDAFRELRAAFAGAVTIRVGDPDHGEHTAAEYRVETPAEVREFLVALAAVRGRAAAPDR